jgi:hypothetical protein
MHTTRSLGKGLSEPLHYFSYCNSFDHVIEECPTLLSKLQEKRGPQQNLQMQLIKAEPHGEDPRVIIITRGGNIIGDDRMTQGKTTKDSGIRKAAEKTQTFDAKKDRQIFEEARK